MINQMQVAPIVSPCPQEEQDLFLSPMPQQIVLGHTTMTNDQEEFLQAFEAGIEAYCADDYSFATTMTAQQLLNDLVETLLDDTPFAWRLGFLAGRITGLLNPDPAETSDRQSTLEALSRKCQLLYPGPGCLSSYLLRLHQAAGIETLSAHEVMTIS